MIRILRGWFLSSDANYALLKDIKNVYFYWGEIYKEKCRAARL